MKGGRELDAKVTAPLFPRLHINDAGNRGGPRAPPRNKMALYEQLSIPSSAHRFRDHGAVSASMAVPVASPPARHGCASIGGGEGSTVPSGSTQGLGCSRERNVFSPYYVQQAAPHPNDDTQSPSARATDASTSRTGFASPSPKSGSRAHPGALQSAETDELSALRNSSCKRNLGNEDDFMVPTFVHSATAWPSGKGLPSIGRCSPSESQKENAKPICSDSNQNQEVTGLPQEQPPGGILTSKKLGRNDAGQKDKAIGTVETLIAKNAVAGAVAEGNPAGPSRILKAFSFLEKENSTLAGFEKSVRGRLPKDPHSSGDWDADAAMIDNGTNTTGEANTIWPNSVKLPSLSDDDTPRNPAIDQDDSDCAATDSGSPILEDMEKDDEDSETSVVDSEPGFDISPDDVVGVIGPKHFWKARRAIVNQQRIFAVQVFELHRLIKVQKLMAASPQLILEGNPCFTRFQKVPSKGKASIRNSGQTARKNDTPKEKRNEPVTETMRVPQHPPQISHKRSFGETLQNRPNSGGNHFHMGSEGRPPGSWCLPPSGSHWLVPVMSASEGLVYKPYVGPCPPSGAFMAPFYGGCAPLVAAPVMGDCIGPAYGFPSPIQQPSVGFPGNHAVAPSYFSAPYGFPVASQLMPPPAMEQVILPRGNSDEHSQSLSSDNMSNHQSEAASTPRVHGGQNDDLQMSSSSSPNARAEEGAGLPSSVVMFPPTFEDSGAAMLVHNDIAMPRVIKVVPHNRRAATETAARIFQFIQEEREHHEPV